MSLLVTVKTSDQDLTTTASVKAELFGASATTTVYDTFLSGKIRTASRMAETFIGQPLTVQTYRETVAGYGRRNLMLSRTPLRAVLGVFDATDTGVANELTTNVRIENADAGFLSQDQGFPWNATQSMRVGAPAFGGDAVPLDFSPAPGQEYRPFLVDYIAGYTRDGLTTASPNWSTGRAYVDGSLGTDTGRSLPEDIEEAVIVKTIAINNGADETQGEKLGDLEVNYRSLGTDGSGRLITRFEDILRRYQRYV